MHLKALEIQGFKSFPERTVITFHEGVTAIIGPNGSGKSNVTDAIRWVLGEQSVKTLRGSRMEDVIFTGTQSRRAMSFAEVTMVIDNQDSILPLDYTEIQITRRLYRSGESEYLLNKTVCRLRDIARLFMDTGLGRDGYSIVGQGRVDEILSHRSEDRRRIFEEASGIVKYKTRKDEAERKLQSTEQNLLRINDLITELESRLTPLEKQSETARRFISLSEKLKKTEIALILDTIDQQNEKLAEAEQEKQAVSSDLAEANLALTSLREKNQQTTAAIRQLDELTARCQKSLGQVNQAVNEHNSLMALHDERINHLQEQMRIAAAEEQELSGSLSGIDAELTVRRGKADTLRLQQAQYRQRLDKSEQAMQVVISALDAAEKAIETDKVQLDQLTEAVYESQVQHGQTKNQLSLIDSRRNTIGHELLELVTDLDRLRLMQEETQADLLNLQQEWQACETARAGQATALEDKRTACNTLALALEQKRQTLRNQAYRHKTLSDLERSHAGYGEAIKHLLQKADQDQDFGRSILGTVGSLLRADRRYELAVETALGPAIAHIVTDDETTAARLIATLKQNRAGRATFLPLNAIHGRSLESGLLSRIEKMPGFIGLASHLVQADDQLKPVVDYLLGRVVITESLDQAIAMARRIRYACKIVTVEGDVLNPGGSMTGGYQRRESASLLSRNREISELEQSIRELTRSVEKETAELAGLEQALQALARETTAREQTLLELSHRRIREESRLSAQKDEQEKVSARQQVLQSEDEQLQQRADQVRKELQDIGQNITAAEQTIADIRARISRQEGANREDREKRDDLREEITQWRVSLQSVDESLKAAEEMILRIEQDRSGQQSRLQRRKKEQSDNQAEIDALQKEKIDLAHALDALQHQGSDLADQARRHMTEKNRLESDQSAFFDNLEAFTARISALQGEISRIEARAIRFEGLIDDAKNRLWEAYELTADQAGAWRQTGISRNEMTRQVNTLKNDIRELGTVNLAAIEEYESVRDRCTFLSGQRDDIDQARNQLKSVITDLTEAMKKQFIEHFHLINENFSLVFAELFGGGMAELNLEDEQDVLACGIEIKAQPPGKKLTNLLLLSGGERCLTAIALLFAILKLRPTPFCVLDEVEAALDDANVLRFTDYIRRYAHDSQFILVTHRKGTMEAADRLYGVTMQERGISRILSMQLTD